MTVPYRVGAASYRVRNCIVRLETSRVCWIDPVIRELKRLEIWVGPGCSRVEHTMDDGADKPIAKIHADVRREVFDPRINLLLVDGPWERENSTSIVHLG